MRTIPGMVVMCPSDDIETKACVRAAAEYEGPVYIRLGRLAVPVINDHPDYEFQWGKGITLKEGDDIAIIATGLCVESAMTAAKMLEEDGISTRVINIHTIKPIDEDIILKAAKECKMIFTVEEHSVIGGLGSAVCDVVSEKHPAVVKKLGVYDVYGHSGPALELLKEFKLDGPGVYEQVKEFYK